MAGSVNKVILVGNLGRDPESRSFQNGGKVVNLRIATSEQWKDRATGERRDKTEWHSVAIFSEGLANVAEKYLRKGSKVYLEGQLQTRKWTDNAGVEKYSTEVVLQGFDAKMVLLDRPDGAGGGTGGGGDRGMSSGGGGGWGDDDGGYGSGSGFGGGSSRGAAAAPAGGRKSDPFDTGDLDDDVPF